jgi:ATP-dependent DNA ligase
VLATLKEMARLCSKRFCDRDLEGIVCKPKNSTYSINGRWREIKNPSYSQAEGRDEMFTAFSGKGSSRVEITSHSERDKQQW